MLCRSVPFDIAAVLNMHAADERPGGGSIELGAQVFSPTRHRPSRLPRLGQMRQVHPLRDHLGVGVRIDETKRVRLAPYRGGRGGDVADFVGKPVGQLPRQDRDDFSHVERRAYLSTPAKWALPLPMFI